MPASNDETHLESLTIVRFSSPARERNFPPVIRMELVQFGNPRPLVETMTHEKAHQVWMALGRALMNVGGN